MRHVLVLSHGIGCPEPFRMHEFVFEAFDIPRGPYLVLGARGMVGRSWLELLRSCDRECRGLMRPSFDIVDRCALAREITASFPVVVNCAAWTDVDGAEHDESGATLANGTAVGWLAAQCRSVGAMLIHYGSDYVFDGEGQAPLTVDAVVRPINAYGRSKACGEHALRESGCEYLMVRTSWIYAPWGKNFVRTMLELASKREQVRVVDDQRGRPTSAEHLVRTSLALLASDVRHTWHVTDGGSCTWYELACELIERSGAKCRVVRGKSAELDRPARRPANSVLDLSSTEALVGRMPCWRVNVAEVMRRLASL